MILDIASVVAGVGLLCLGADGLVRGSTCLARWLKLTPLVIGLTVVAFGTSMPELVVSVDAAVTGAAAIAAGNVVGSNIANVALILGLSAILCPLAVNTRVVRVDLPLMMLASLVLAIMLFDQRVGRLEGSLLALGLIAYTVSSLKAARRETASDHYVAAIPADRLGIPASVGFIVGGLAILVIGAHLLVTGAVAIAEASGISEAVIGLTVVAIGTSLPELATSVIASLKREGDIAVGNIVGSSLFNILGILGTASLVRPLHGTSMSPVDLGVMVALAVLLLPLARSGWRVNRWEGGFLFATYAGYVTYLLR